MATQNTDLKRAQARAAAAFARDYGEQDVAAQLLPGEHDLNFLIHRDGSPVAVYKLVRNGAEAPLVDMQCAALNHVAQADQTAPMPRVRQRLDGAQFAGVEWPDGTRQAFAMTHLAGRKQAELPPLDAHGLRALGRAIGRLDRALAGFDHPDLARRFEWNLTEAAEHARHCHHIDAPLDRVAATVLARFSREAAPVLSAMPQQAVHNDLNDHNVLLRVQDFSVEVCGVIDVGDMARQPVLCDLAIACAYSAMRQSDPIAACALLAAGFDEVIALGTDDIDVLPLLIKTRLAVSLAMSSRRMKTADCAPYHLVSHEMARSLLGQLEAVPEAIFRLRLRQCLGRRGLPHRARVLRYLDSAEPHAAIHSDAGVVLDLGVGSLMLGADPSQGALAPLTRRIDDELARQDTTIGLGRYLEPRLLYAAAGFGAAGHATADRRTVHLGIDVFCASETPVQAPLAGRVHAVASLDRPLDYGPVVMLRHDLPDGESFFTLYGHLDPEPALRWRTGDVVDAGTVIGRVGAPPGNGGWPPHLHLQLILDDLGQGAEFPGVCDPRETDVYAELCPNPAVLLGRSDGDLLDARRSADALLKRRRERIGPSLSLSYRRPMHVVRGFGPYLYDEHARAHLDFYNNVAHVGHSHPHVVGAVQRQIGLLNTNTRYLHDAICDYAERLTDRFPDPLSVCYFVNSASEANELALRLARVVTGRKDVIVAADAYHGHTSALIDMSPYKYNGPGGEGPADWVHDVPVADDYRGAFRRDDPMAGAHYAQSVADRLAALDDTHACAAFFAETMPSVGGQLIPPPGYLRGVYDAVRAHGGLCIADEVQTGFGRLGEAFWGFQTQNVVPDIVVLGKPIANGFPMGAVITTQAIAEAFDNGMEFFATFGGNPVACVAASAMLDVLDHEQLPARAQRLGTALMDGLRDIATRCPLIGDVRGMGFFLGVELVLSRDSLEPAAAATADLVERLRAARLLAGSDGPLHNVLKLRPTLATTDDDVAFALDTLERACAETQVLHDASLD